MVRKEVKPIVLIVEDEIESRKYFQLILSKKFEVDFCDTKKSMFELLDTKTYDVILMDVSLKNGHSGIELIKELKRKSSFKNIPIICISAHAYGEERLKAEMAGADDYLIKPVGNKVLLTTLSKFIATQKDDKEDNP